MSTTDMRGWTVRFGPGNITMITETCIDCGVVFAMTAEFKQTRLENHSKRFYCPNGHHMVYSGKTEAEKLRDLLAAAKAQAVHATDQAYAAAVEVESLRTTLLRDRHRFANGVCPCCNRSFENVRRHMENKHPDYDVAKVINHAAPVYKCSCGQTSTSLGGLHRHQNHWREGEWWNKPKGNRWSGAHLTVVSS